MEMNRGPLPVKRIRDHRLIMGYWEEEYPDRPHEQWALHYFDAESYEKAAKKVSDGFDHEGNEIHEAFNNGYWTVADIWHSGKGKTRDAALIDYAFDKAYNYEGDW